MNYSVDFYKELFYKEQENEIKIRSNMTFFLGLMQLLLPVSSFYWDHITSNKHTIVWGMSKWFILIDNYHNSNFWIIYMVITILIVVFDILAIILAIRTFIGYTYREWPTASEIRHYEFQLGSFYDENFTEAKESLDYKNAKKEFIKNKIDTWVIDSICEAIDHNKKQNDLKIKRGNWSTIWFYFALFFSAIGFLFYLFSKLYMV